MQQMDVIQTVPIKVKAGPQMISAAFINKAYGPIQDTVMPFDFALVNTAIGTVSGLTGLPHLRDLGIKGPYNVTGLGDTPVAEVLVCSAPPQLRKRSPVPGRSFQTWPGRDSAGR